MKKSRNIFISTAILLGAVFALSCTMNAAADMGDNVRDYSSVSVGTGGSSGSGSGSSSSWDVAFVESGYQIFDYMSWGDYDAASEMALSSDGMKITRTGAWAGGGLVPADSSKKFDFTGIKKISFDIINSEVVIV